MPESRSGAASLVRVCESDCMGTGLAASADAKSMEERQASLQAVCETSVGTEPTLEVSSVELEHNI